MEKYILQVNYQICVCIYIYQPINYLDLKYKGQQSISVLEPYQNS